MRVIITESQFQCLFNENYQNILIESLFSDKTKESIKNKIRLAMLTGVSLITILAAINKSKLDTFEKQRMTRIAKEIANEQHRADSIFDVRVDACRKYMETALANKGYSLHSTKLKPEAIVQASIQYNFDLPFLMAVLHQESCFGATPRAQRTNSPFSVGLYDDGRNIVTYSNPNESIGDYIKLLNRDYLINGKTLMDLLKPNSFVNKNGDRYAQDKNYEAKIKNLRNNIANKYPVLR